MSDIIQFNIERFGNLPDALSHLEAVMFQDRTPLTAGILWEQWAGSYLNTLSPTTTPPLDSDAKVFSQEDVVDLIGEEVVSVEDFLALVGGFLVQRTPGGDIVPYAVRAEAYGDAFRTDTIADYSSFTAANADVFQSSLAFFGEPSTALGWQIVEIVRAIDHFGEGAINAALISRNNASEPPVEEPAPGPGEPPAPGALTVGGVLGLYGVDPSIFVQEKLTGEDMRKFAEVLHTPIHGGDE
jgi:hypothetical protein